MPASKYGVEAATSVSMFNDRAPGYDAGSGGWHVELALDFVKWTKPKPGDAILDLACGTGLVTIPAAAAAGEFGSVIGVDISTGMLSEARKKNGDPGAARIEWIEHDVTDLTDVEAIQRVVTDRGGFDIVFCCSALVLLVNPSQVIRYWAGLLKPGGKMVIDVPTEDKTLQHLFMVDVRNAVGTPLPFKSGWIRSVRSLEELYEDAGLEIERSFRTRSYIPERWYEADQSVAIFDEQMETYKSFGKDGKVEEARPVFEKLFKDNLRDNGKFWDGHALYVTIGKKVRVSR